MFNNVNYFQLKKRGNIETTKHSNNANVHFLSIKLMNVQLCYLDMSSAMTFAHKCLLIHLIFSSNTITLSQNFIIIILYKRCLSFNEFYLLKHNINFSFRRIIEYISIGRTRNKRVSK